MELVSLHSTQQPDMDTHIQQKAMSHSRVVSEGIPFPDISKVVTKLFSTGLISTDELQKLTKNHAYNGINSMTTVAGQPGPHP